MTNDQTITWQGKAETALLTKNYGELVAGYLRYEALRKLNPRQFAELNRRNLAGENFDEMVDELVAQP